MGVFLGSGEKSRSGNAHSSISNVPLNPPSYAQLKYIKINLIRQRKKSCKKVFWGLFFPAVWRSFFQQPKKATKNIVQISSEFPDFRILTHFNSF